VLAPHPRLDGRWHQAGHLSSQAEDFFDQARAEIRVLLGRHHENGLERWFEVTIHQGHLELVLVVRDRPNTPDDGARAPAARVIDEQAIVKSGFFSWLTSTATRIRSNRCALRRMISTCPFVIGSNEPGKIASRPFGGSGAFIRLMIIDL
jgi:hypothetical protein